MTSKFSIHSILSSFEVDESLLDLVVFISQSHDILPESVYFILFVSKKKNMFAIFKEEIVQGWLNINKLVKIIFKARFEILIILNIYALYNIHYFQIN